MDVTGRNQDLYNVPKSEILQNRKAFYGLQRENNETIEKWLKRVQNCISHCEFPMFIEFLLIDRFVCGLDSTEMKIVQDTVTWSLKQLLDHFLNRNINTKSINDKSNEKIFVDDYDSDENFFDYGTYQPDLSDGNTDEEDFFIKAEPLTILENERYDDSSIDLEKKSTSTESIFDQNTKKRGKKCKTKNGGNLINDPVNEIDDQKTETEQKGKKRKRRSTSKSTGEKQYNCDVCESTFQHASNLHVHKKVVHKKIRPHACKLCEKTFPNVFSLKRHTLSHKGEKTHTCELCKKLFASSTNLAMHIKTVHEGIRSHSCDQCEKSFTSSYHLDQHKKVAHEGIRAYRCEVCGKGFTKSSGLKRHLLNHTGERPFSCDECEKTFTRASILKVHKESVHGGIRPYACKRDQCDKSFTLEYGLKKHMLTHTGERPHECSECGKRFTQASVLKSHKKVVHLGIRPHECPVCGKGFPSTTTLRKHSISHTSLEISRQYICDLCGKSFIQLSSLKMHKKTIHDGIRDYQCETCEKRFKDAYGLKAHSLTHTGEKPYSCDLCSKLFISNSNLEKHKRSIHQRILPYSCKICDRSFPNASSLKRHELSHTGEKPFSCIMCDNSFNRLSDLKTHEQECMCMESTIEEAGVTAPEVVCNIKAEP